MTATAKARSRRSWGMRMLPLLLGGALLLAHSAASQEPKPAKPLTAEQQGKLKERDRLVGEAYRLEDAGKLVEAIATMEKAVALHRDVLGRDDVAAIIPLQFIAEVHEARADFAAARKTYQEMLDIGGKLQAKEHWLVSDAQRGLADMERLEKMSATDRQLLVAARATNRQVLQLLQQGKAREAVAPAEKTAQTRKQLLGDKHPDYAQSLSNLAAVYRALGDYAGAEPLCRQALEIRSRLGKHPRHAESLNQLVELYQTQGNYLKAEPLSRQALEVSKQVFGERHPQYATSLNSLASLYQAQGDYAQAEPLFRQSLEIRKQVLGDKHPHYALGLNNLAALYQTQGDYAKADAFFRLALGLRKELFGEKHPDYIVSLNNLAVLYMVQGDYAKAELLCRQALDLGRPLLGEKHPYFASLQVNLAQLYKLQGEYAKAEPLYRQALEVYRQVGESHPGYASGLNNLAALYAAQGDYAKAEPLYRQALELRKRLRGDKHLDYAVNLNNLAMLYKLQGDYAQAEALCRQALQVYREALGEKHPGYALGLSKLAEVYWAQGDHARAEPLLGQALALTRTHQDLAAAAQSERQQLRMTESLRYQLDGYLSVTRAAGSSGSKAYEPVLSWKGAITARQQRLRLERRDPELVEELRRVSSRLATLAFATPDPRQSEVYRQQMLQLSERKEQLEKDVAEKSAAVRQNQQLARLTPEGLRQSLPAGTVLVDLLEYWHSTPDPKNKGKLAFERRLAAFVVPSGRAPSKAADIVQLDLGPVQPLAEAIDKWRQTIGTRTRPLENDQDPAALLRQRLWRPLEPYVKDAQTVLLSPDGVVARLPLAALPGARPATFLIEETALVVVPVPQLLPALLDDRPSEGRAAKASLLLVGDVDYGAEAAVADARHGTSRAAVLPADQREKVAWPRLPASKTEILAIRDTFRRHAADGVVVVLLQGGQATEAAVRQEAPRHRYLHLATHGFFADPRLRSALMPEEKTLLESGQFGREGFIGFHPGLLSGLVLGGANRPVQPDHDDGILTALEVAELDLQNVELAVLSACETGLGATAGGEGVLGLQRAFQVAGARNIVTSLWKVDDEATAALMALFYHKLWQENKPPLAALREAQLTLYHHPARIASLAKERGPDFDKLVKLPTTPPKDAQPGDKAPVKLWAAFVLSGTGK